MIKLTIIIPVYNEIKTFEKLLNQVIRLNFRKQIIVVDDCSTDGTKNILVKRKNKIDKVIFHKKYGKRLNKVLKNLLKVNM